MKCGCSIYFFFNSANLICRGKGISNIFRKFLGLRDNESRMYIVIYYYLDVIYNIYNQEKSPYKLRSRSTDTSVPFVLCLNIHVLQWY